MGTATRRDPRPLPRHGVRAISRTAGASRLHRARGEPARHGRRGHAAAHQDRQPPGAAIAPVRADALPAEHAGPRAGVPVHQQSAGLAHRPDTGGEIRVLAGGAAGRARLRHRRVPLRAARAGRQGHVPLGRDGAVRQHRQREAARLHVGRDRGMGVGREPGHGLLRDRHARRCRTRRDRRALARRQGGALGRRRGSALRDGRVERVGGGRRRLEPPRLRRDRRAHQHGVPALVHRHLQDVQRTRGGAARRSAHAPGARGATGALRGERGPGSVGRSARRVPVPRRVVTGVRPVGRAADRRPTRCRRSTRRSSPAAAAITCGPAATT